jgi:ABC-type sugar transport system substrate-binding protein
MKNRKLIALIMSILLILSLFAGCGGTTSPTQTAAPAPVESEAPMGTEAPAPAQTETAVVTSAFPAVPDLGGMTSNEWLVSRDDKKPLGGVVSSHFDSRADIYKGLDQVDHEDNDVVIAWLSASLGSDFFTEREKSAKAVCDKYGYKFINYDANFDLTTQIEQLENVLTQDIDFLMINAIDIDALSIYYKQAAEMAGQPYDDIYDAGVIGYNTWIECRDKGSAVIPGIINCVGYVTTGGIDPATAQPAAAELLTAHPEMDLVLCESGSFGTGIVNECIQAGVVPGKDILIAYAADGEGYVLDLVKTGEVMCSGTNLPYPCGEDVVELIHSIISEGFDANDIPANSYVPTYVVTPDNVDEVYTKGDVFCKSLEPWSILTTDEYNAQFK